MNPAWPFARRIASRVWQRLARVSQPRASRLFAVSGYIAMSRLPGFTPALDCRTSLLAAELAAQLSGCRWCIERARHECRKAGAAGQRIFTERERAALEFVEAVARSESTAEQPADHVLERARCFLSDIELAELTAIVAEHHCLESSSFNHSGT
jgi:hypothetical protein